MCNWPLLFIINYSSAPEQGFAACGFAGSWTPASCVWGLLQWSWGIVYIFIHKCPFWTEEAAFVWFRKGRSEKCLELGLQEAEGMWRRGELSANSEQNPTVGFLKGSVWWGSTLTYTAILWSKGEIFIPVNKLQELDGTYRWPKVGFIQYTFN